MSAPHQVLSLLLVTAAYVYLVGRLIYWLSHRNGRWGMGLDDACALALVSLAPVGLFIWGFYA